MRAEPASPAAIVSRYRTNHQDLIDRHPEFAAWLEDEYVPIAGGWQY
jgi:hypothetical protein